MRRSLRGLEREGFRYVFELSSLEDVDAVTIKGGTGLGFMHHIYHRARISRKAVIPSSLP